MDGIIVNAMRFMAFCSWASICLSTSRETNSAGGHQTTGALVERQVYCEQDITPIVIKVHRQVDEGRVRVHIIHLDPPNLGWIQPHRFSLVENKLIIDPGGAL